MPRPLLISSVILIAAAPLASAQQVAPQPAQTPQAAPAAHPKPKPKPKPVAAKKPAAPAEAAAPEAKARLVVKIKDWTVYLYEGAEGRVCFAAAAPTDMQPKAAKRTPVIFYVTDWQKDGVRNEISVKQGYSMKAGAAATVTIGGQNFALAAADDKAFVKNPEDERKLIAAMSNGGTMAVKGVSAKGTTTTDEYSLAGLAESVEKLQESCP